MANANSSKLPNVKDYMKNLAGSIKYSAIDVLKSQVPTITEFVEDNSNTIKETYKSIAGIKRESLVKSVSDSIQNSYPYQAANELMKNMKDDLRTGKFYNAERASAGEEMLISRLLGADFASMMDMDGFDSDDSSDDSVKSTPKKDNTITKGDALIANVFTKSSARTANYVGDLFVRASDSINKANKGIAALQLTQLTKQNVILENGMNGMIQGVNSIISFNNKAMLTHIANSKIYYDNMTQLTRQNNAMLNELLTMQRNLYTKQQYDEKVDNGLNASNIFKGGLNLKEYGKLIKKNALERTPLGMAAMMVEMFPMIAQEAVSNPMNFISKQVIGTLIGPKVKKALNNFDKTFAGFFQTAAAKLNKMGKQKNGDPIMTMIGKLFGFSENNSSLRRIDLSKYDKGAMSWNGIAQKSLTEVIPGYLSRIEASLSGKGERIFNFNSGKWGSRSSATSIDKEYNNKYSNIATKDLRKEMHNLMMPMILEANAEDRKEIRKTIQDISKGIFREGMLDFGDISKNKNGKYGNNNKLVQEIADNILSRVSIQTKMGIVPNINKAKHDKNQLFKYIQNNPSEYNNIIESLNGSSNDSIKKINSKLPKSPALSLYEEKDRYGNTMYDYAYKANKELYAIRNILQNSNQNTTGRTNSHRRNIFSGFSMKTESSSDESAAGGGEEPPHEKIIDPKYKNKYNTKINDYLKKYGINSKDLNSSLNLSTYLNDPIYRNVTGNRYDRYANKIMNKDTSKYIKGVNSNDTFLKQLMSAASIGDKFKVITNSLSNLTKAPQDILTGVISKADKFMYDMLFGKETNIKDENGRPIKGLYDRMLYSMGQSMKKFNTWLDTTIINPMSEKVKKYGKNGIDIANNFIKEITGIDLKENANKVSGYVKNSIGGGIRETAKSAYNTAKSSISDTYSDIKNAVTSKSDSFKKPSINKIDYSNIENKAKSLFGLANGAKQVKKGGLAFISEGEAIIPADLNPWNPNKDTVDRNAQSNRENSWKEKFKNTIKDKLGKYIIPTRSDGVASNSGELPIDVLKYIFENNPEIAKLFAKIGLTSEQFSSNGAKYKPKDDPNSKFINTKGFNNAIRQFTTSAFGTDPGKAMKTAGTLIKKNAPTIAGGAVVGNIMSTLLPLGGPLMGSIVGASVNILRNSSTVQEYLFGKDMIEDGKTYHKEGAIPQTYIDAFNKYIPDAKKWGIAGGLAGLILPFGPLGGVMLGLGASMAKNNADINKYLFGDKGGLINKNRRQMIKKALPQIAAGTLSTMILGPFGLLGNAALGAGLGILSTSEEFKRTMLGYKDKNGVRHGGIAGAIQRQITNPLKTSMDGFKKDITKYFRDDIFKPLGKGIFPMLKMGGAALKLAIDSVGKSVSDKIKGTFIEKIADKGLAGIRNIASFGKNAIKFAAKGPAGLAKKIGQAGSNIANPWLIQHAPELSGMSAGERYSYMSNKNRTYKNMETDRNISGQSQGQLENNAIGLQALYDLLENNGGILHGKTKEVNENVRSGLEGLLTGTNGLNQTNELMKILGTRTKDQGAISKAIKTVENGKGSFDKLSKVDKEKLIDFLTKETDDFDKVYAQRDKFLHGRTENKALTDTLSQYGINVPEGVDPNEFIKKSGNKGMLKNLLGRTEYELNSRKKASGEQNSEAKEEESDPLVKATKEQTGYSEQMVAKAEKTNQLLSAIAAMLGVNSEDFNALEINKDTAKLIGKDFADYKINMAGMKFNKNTTANESINRLQENLNTRLNKLMPEMRSSVGNDESAVNRNFSGTTFGSLYTNSLENQNKNSRKNSREMLNSLKLVADNENQHNSHIENIDELVKLGKDALSRISKLTMMGYSIKESNYKDIADLSDTAFSLVQKLAENGTMFDSFKTFSHINDDENGKAIAQGILQLAESKRSSNSKTTYGQELTSSQLGSISRDRGFNANLGKNPDNTNRVESFARGLEQQGPYGYGITKNNLSNKEKYTYKSTGATNYSQSEVNSMFKKHSQDKYSGEWEENFNSMLGNAADTWAELVGDQLNKNTKALDAIIGIFDKSKAHTNDLYKMYNNSRDIKKNPEIFARDVATQSAAKMSTGLVDELIEKLYSNSEGISENGIYPLLNIILGSKNANKSITELIDKAIDKAANDATKDLGGINVSDNMEDDNKSFKKSTNPVFGFANGISSFKSNLSGIKEAPKAELSREEIPNLNENDSTLVNTQEDIKSNGINKKSVQNISRISNSDGDYVEYTKSNSNGELIPLRNKHNIEVEKKNNHKIVLQERSTNALENIANKLTGFLGKGKNVAKKASGGLFDILKDLLGFPKKLLGDLGSLVSSIPFLGPLLMKGMGLGLKAGKWAGGKLLDLGKYAGTKFLNNTKAGRFIGNTASKFLNNTKIGRFTKKVGGKLFGDSTTSDFMNSDPSDPADAINSMKHAMGDYFEQVLNAINNNGGNLGNNGSLLENIENGLPIPGKNIPGKGGRFSTAKKWAGRGLKGAAAALGAYSLYKIANPGSSDQNQNDQNSNSLLDYAPAALSTGSYLYNLYNKGKTANKGFAGESGINIEDKEFEEYNRNILNNRPSNPNNDALLHDKNTLEKMNSANNLDEASGGLKEKAQMLVSTLKDGITQVISKISKFIPSKASKSIELFTTKLLEKITTPENLKKAVVKLSKQLTSAAAGAATAGIGTVLLDIGFALTGFYQGYSSTDQMLKLPPGSATSGMKVVGGIVTALCTALPIGIIIPEDYVLELAIKYIGPAFGFSEKDLDELKRTGKQKDQKEQKQAFDSSVFGNDWQQSLKIASDSVFSTVVQGAHSISGSIANNAKYVYNKIGDAASTGFNFVKNTASSVGSWIKEHASAGADFLEKAASNTYNTAKEIAGSAVNMAKQGGQYIYNKASDALGSAKKAIFGSGKSNSIKIPKKKSMYGMGNFYSQLDPKYSMSYNTSGDNYEQTMADSGCGPMSAVNAASAMGVDIDPKLAANYALKAGFKEHDGGTKPEYFNSLLSKEGMGASKLNGSSDILKKLKQGNPVILMGKDDQGESNKNPYGENPHYVTATGLDKNNNLIIQDPETNTPNKTYKASNVLNKTTMAIGTSRFGTGKKSISYKRYSRFGRGNDDVGQTIWNTLIDKGFSAYAAAGIMGNMMQESGLRPGAFQNHVKPDGPDIILDGSTGYGLCQWTTLSRQQGLLQYANSLGTQPNDIQAQIGWMMEEMGPDNINAINQQNSVEDATVYFHNSFEGSADTDLSPRINYANKAFQTQGKGMASAGTYSGGSSSSTPKKSGFLGAISNISDILSSALMPSVKASPSISKTSANNNAKTNLTARQQLQFSGDKSQNIIDSKLSPTRNKFNLKPEAHTSNDQVMIDIANTKGVISDDNYLSNSGLGKKAIKHFKPKYGAGKHISRWGRDTNTIQTTNDINQQGINANKQINANTSNPEMAEYSKVAAMLNSGGGFNSIINKAKALASPVGSAVTKLFSSIMSSASAKYGPLLPAIFGSDNPFGSILGFGQQNSGPSSSSSGTLGAPASQSLADARQHAMQRVGTGSGFAEQGIIADNSEGCTSWVKEYLTYSGAKIPGTNDSIADNMSLYVPTFNDQCRQWGILQGPDYTPVEGDVAFINVEGDEPNRGTHVVITDGAGGYWGNGSSTKTITHNSMSVWDSNGGPCSYASTGRLAADDGTSTTGAGKHGIPKIPRFGKGKRRNNIPPIINNKFPIYSKPNKYISKFGKATKSLSSYTNSLNNSTVLPTAVSNFDNFDNELNNTILNTTQSNNSSNLNTQNNDNNTNQIISPKPIINNNIETTIITLLANLLDEQKSTNELLKTLVNNTIPNGPDKNKINTSSRQPDTKATRLRDQIAALTGGSRNGIGDALKNGSSSDRLSSLINSLNFVTER